MYDSFVNKLLIDGLLDFFDTKSVQINTKADEFDDFVILAAALCFVFVYDKFVQKNKDALIFLTSNEDLIKNLDLDYFIKFD